MDANTGVRVVEVDDGLVVISLRGELDADNVSDEFRVIRDVLRTHHTDIRLDLRDVCFVDSTAIATFVELRAELATAGRSVRLRNPTPAVHRVLEITGVLEILGLR